MNSPSLPTYAGHYFRLSVGYFVFLETSRGRAPHGYGERNKEHVEREEGGFAAAPVSGS